MTDHAPAPQQDPTANPWRTLTSREVYANPWISVREDEVVRPDGQPGVYGVVTTRPATGVVALTDDDRVVLVGQYRYTLEEYSWEIVEGGADPGERIEDAIARELQEEAGLTAAHWEPLGAELALSNSVSDERAYLFLATGLTEVADDPEGTEVLQRRIVPLQEAIAMVERGEITDAMSVVALLRVARLRDLGER